MPQRTLHVVSHTHWDREWYLTFQQFRVRLVDLMDHLLDILETDPDFRYFNLDGQTIILEDYLEIRPEKRDLIRRYAQEGRIVVGPWFVLNDEFLASGESTIRSLLLGHATASEFGPVMKVGYLPDQFGNISQMPQILRGFGIDNAIFGRGVQIVGDRKMEFVWRAPDGSEVLASLMAFWYNNAQRIPPDESEAVEYLRNITDRMAPISHTGHLLLMNGVDHLEPQPDVGRIIARLDGKLGEDRVRHSTLPAYVHAIRESVEGNGAALDTITGELREDRQCNVLAGTLSSRMYIKQANERCQTALEKYAEPAASFAHMLGDDYPAGLLDYAWKLLMKNHPHDSICGCSIDQVHREMMPRFDQVRQVADEVTRRALDSIAGRVRTEGDSIVVFNPLNWTRTDRVRATIDFQVSEATRERPVADPARDVEWIRVLDETGAEALHAIVSARTIAKQILSPHELPFVAMFKRFEIELLAEDVPACGYRVYGIAKADAPSELGGSLASEAYRDRALVNEFLRLSVHGGSVNLERCAGSGDMSRREVYSNVNTFEDGGDVGDEYLYVRPADDVTATSLDSCPSISLIDLGPVSATFKLEMSLRLPVSANADMSGRDRSTVECPVTSYLTVTRGVPRVDVVTTVDNRAKDHRLRVLFPSGTGARVSHAEGQFDVLERRVGVPEDWPRAAPFHPQQRWMDVGNGNSGLCVINKGLPEYEVYTDDARTAAVTLLRCVGRLSGGADAPGAQATPEAQCPGEHTFEYALYPHAGDWEEARVWMQAHQHNVPMKAVQTGAHDGDLPPRMSFVETSHPELVISAIKRAETSDMLVVRFYNTSTKQITGGWVRARGARSAKLLNLNEEVQPAGVDFSDGAARLDVPAKKIVTLGFEL